MQQNPVKMENAIENEVNDNVKVNDYEVKFYWEILYNEDKNVKIDVETGEVILESFYTVEKKK